MIGRRQLQVYIRSHVKVTCQSGHVLQWLLQSLDCRGNKNNGGKKMNLDKVKIPETRAGFVEERCGG